jgi:hypothetical protein
MLARRHLVSSATHLTSFASTAQPAAGQAFSPRDVSGAASTAHFPRHGGSTCSHGLGDLAIAIGAMELAAPSCCRLGLLAGDHLVLLASAVICLGPSAGRPTQATSRASQPARLPRTAGRRRSARAMFQMPPRTGGGGPVRQAPPPTASPRRRVAGSVILRGRGRGGDPRRRATPLPGLTAEAEPGSARLGLRWRWRAWLTSFGPSRPLAKDPLRSWPL